MTTTTARNGNQAYSIFKEQQKSDKNRAVTFGIQSAHSIPCSTATKNHNKNSKGACLPINFFHRPGQYNKMLIQMRSNQNLNNIDRQIGILRSLQYLNQPIFDKAKQKKEQRLKDYQNKRRQQRSIKTDSRISKCICCCCDDFCQDCAANTLCEASSNVDQNGTNTKMAQKWLIDIQAMKRGEYKKKPTPLISSSSQIQRCHQRKEISHIRIQELINKTLIQTIQEKRDKQLQLLVKRQQKIALKEFNESVRTNNRCFSAEKSRSKVELKPTKAEIRQAYWESIKDLIKYQLKRPKDLKKQTKMTEQLCHKQSPDKYDQKQLHKLQKQRGKSAEKQMKRAKLEKAQKAKQKIGKLLALDAKQREIVKKCHSKRFKPDEQMIEAAFAHFV